GLGVVELGDRRRDLLLAVVTDGGLVVPAQRAADFKRAEQAMLGDAAELEVRADAERVAADLRIGGAFGLLDDVERRADKGGEVLGGGLGPAVAGVPPEDRGIVWRAEHMVGS